MVMPDNTILITGGTGLLGKSLVDIFREHHDIVATYIGEYEMADQHHVSYLKIDIQDYDSYGRLFREIKPDVVIHTASIGSPDYAEKNKEITRRINVTGTERIIALCKEYGSKFVYISSNGIYDGDHSPYAEDDEIRPINFYGMVKFEGEVVTLASDVVSAIVRPNIMYGWHHPFERSNIVTLAIDKLAKGERFMALDDVFVMPLFVDECARSIWKIVEEGRYETFNIAGRDRVSIFQLIRRVARIFDLDDDLVIPIGQDYFNELIPRPKDTSFRTDKMERNLGIRLLSIDEGLEIMKQQRTKLDA